MADMDPNTCPCAPYNSPLLVLDLPEISSSSSSSSPDLQLGINQTTALASQAGEKHIPKGEIGIGIGRSKQMTRVVSTILVTI
ncbi:hypothetical protein GQ457_05G015220 [Hibiscus cannabinus]